VLWVFLSIYPNRGYVAPPGRDTPQYIWKANIVSVGGLRAVKEASPPPFNTNLDRPAYPLLAAMLHTIVGISPFDMSFVLPAVAALVIGLAAGALAIAAIDEPWWAFPVFLVAVGASVNVARMGLGWTDNLVVSTVIAPAAVLVLIAADGKSAIGGSIVLLGAAFATHWLFTALFGLVLVGTAVLLLPESIAARRRGVSLLRTPSARIAQVVLGSAIIGGGGLLLAPGAPRPPRGLSIRKQLGKANQVVTHLHLSVTGPLAAAGAVVLAVPLRARRLRALALMLVWVASGVAGLVWLHLHHRIAAHRILSFTLAIPILVAAALVGVSRWLGSRLSVVGAVIGAAVITVGLAASVSFARETWYASQPFMTPLERADLATAARYLEEVPGSPYIVFVVDLPVGIPDYGLIQGLRRIRAALPGEDAGRTYVYLGDPQDALLAKPSIRGDPRFDVVSRRFWPGIRPILSSNPVILTLAPYNQHFLDIAHQHPDWEVAAGLLVIKGPRPTGLTASPLPKPPTIARLAWRVVIVVGALGVIGMGWSASLTPSVWPARAAVAPGFGVAVLVLASFLADKVGFRVSGGTGIAIALLTTALGWLPFALRGRGLALPIPRFDQRRRDRTIPSSNSKK
jgi:hypothetical protein